MSKTIGQLWKKKSKGLVANGVLDVVAGLPLKISVFINEKKEKDSKQADYNIIISEPMDKEEQDKRNEEGGL